MENGDTSGCGGKRYNQGKLEWHLFPIEVFAGAIRVMMMGKKKYGEYNWQKGMGWLVVYDCLMRHLHAWKEGEDVDSESGELHLSHVACNVLFLLWYYLNKKGLDDRRCDHDEAILYKPDNRQTKS